MKNIQNVPNPALKIVSGPSSTHEGLSEAAMVGMATFVSAFSQAVDLMPHDEIDLHHF